MLKPDTLAANGFEADVAEGEVHLWIYNLRLSATEYQNLWSVLEPFERRRASRFVSHKQQVASVAGRGWLRLLLAGYTRVAPESIHFALGAHGKPRLQQNDEDRGLVFNISHSGQKLVIAISRNCMLGVDLEQIRPIGNMAGMARRCFAEPEFDVWQKLSENSRIQMFFGLWTLKESGLKASGSGLSAGMKHCVFSLAEPPEVLALPACCGDPASWTFHTLDCGEGYCGALAARTGVQRILYRTLPADSLIDLYLSTSLS